MVTGKGSGNYGGLEFFGMAQVKIPMEEQYDNDTKAAT